jgi:hypothetical protein
MHKSVVDWLQSDREGSVYRITEAEVKVAHRELVSAHTEEEFVFVAL